MDIQPTLQILVPARVAVENHRPVYHCHLAVLEVSQRSTTGSTSLAVDLVFVVVERPRVDRLGLRFRDPGKLSVGSDAVVPRRRTFSLLIVRSQLVPRDQRASA